MDYYFTAADDTAALAARDLPGGPMPGAAEFVSVEAKDIIACPHLEQLVSIATGRGGSSLVPELQVLWPEPSGLDEQLNFDPGPSITRLPSSLRDDLCCVEMTAEIAAEWAEQMWGFDPAPALAIGIKLVQLAQAAQKQNQHIYWWSEV